MNIEALAREAGLIAWTADGAVCSADEALTRFAALIRAQADAEATERLSIIADELIAGLGEPGRGLAEMIREGATALESHAAYVVRDVRAHALDEAARVCERLELSNTLLGPADCAVRLRALKDKP